MFDTALLSKPLFLLRRLARRLWVRTSLIAALALVAAALGSTLGAFVPPGLAERLSPDAVAGILQILASSMLAVTTFSLSVMVTARQWASQQSTPRAHRVVREDPVTQTALATFLGAFVFALVSLILVEIGLYAGGSVVVILGFTIAVIFLVVLAILRWIDHLSELGGVAATARRIEEQARAAFDRAAEQPCLGARPGGPDEAPDDARPIPSRATGYVQHIDAGRLDAIAKDCGGAVWIAALPGAFVTDGDTLLLATGEADADGLRAAFTLGDSRSFEQDPRFGLVVLAEIAQRALSPGVNDPGTAVAAIRRLLRLLLGAKPRPAEGADVPFPNVTAPTIPARALVDEAYAAIARDAGGTVEVHVALQSALARLTRTDDPDMADAARATSARALAFAEEALLLDEDKRKVTDAAPGD